MTVPAKEGYKQLFYRCDVKTNIRNRTSNTEIGRAKAGWGAAETGFASPISVLQVLF